MLAVVFPDREPGKGQADLFCDLALFVTLARAAAKSERDRPGRNISAVRHEPVEPMPIRR
jgi:hypothetical protein